MSSLANTLEAMFISLRTVFRAPVTEELPWKTERERTERFRSTFALVHDDNGEEACIGCKMCEKICPSDIIRVVPGGRKESPVTGKKRGYCDDFTLDLNACIVCELCVQVCPTDAILMLAAPEPPGFSREALFLTMEKLYANETLEQLSWGTGAKLVEMQDPKRGQPKPERKPRAARATAPAAAAPAAAAPAEAAPAEATTEAAEDPQKPPTEEGSK